MSGAIELSENRWLVVPEIEGFSESVSSGIGIVFVELGASKQEEIAKRHPIPIKSTRSNQAIITPKPIFSETLDNYTHHTKNATVIESKCSKKTNGL